MLIRGYWKILKSKRTKSHNPTTQDQPLLVGSNFLLGGNNFYIYEHTVYSIFILFYLRIVLVKVNNSSCCNKDISESQ